MVMSEEKDKQVHLVPMGAKGARQHDLRTLSKTCCLPSAKRFAVS